MTAYSSKNNIEYNKPKVGDYVTCSYIFVFSSTQISNQEFIHNRIGKIIKDNWSVRYPYAVSYDDIPDGIWVSAINDIKVMIIGYPEIVYFSSDIDDVERFIETKKFNL